MKIKKIVLAVAALFVSTLAFAHEGPYASADEETAKLLVQVDELIAQEKYASAFGKLSGVENEYTIAKQSEIMTNYFVTSLMHQMFALKDLEKGENLYDLRVNQDGEFSLIMFDPIAVIDNYIEENGEKPILNYAKGLYYSDTAERYGDQWLISRDELLQKTIEFLSKAYEADCFDGFSLSELGLAYYRCREAEKAQAIFERKLSEGYEFTADDNFNYGAVNYTRGKYEKGLYYAELSIGGYKNVPDYQMDAYVLAARCALEMDDLSKAESLLKAAVKKFPGEYYPLTWSMTLYARKGDAKNLQKTAMSIFAIQPGHPDLVESIMSDYLQGDMAQHLPAFFAACEKKYKKSNAALEGIYFYWAYFCFLSGDQAGAKKYVEKAKLAFQSEGQLTSDIEGYLDSFIVQEEEYYYPYENDFDDEDI